jgi:hypothetical protein
LRAHGKLADSLDPLHFGARTCGLTHLLLFVRLHPTHICRRAYNSKSVAVIALLLSLRLHPTHICRRAYSSKSVAVIAWFLWAAAMTLTTTLKLSKM